MTVHTASSSSSASASAFGPPLPLAASKAARKDAPALDPPAPPSAPRGELAAAEDLNEAIKNKYTKDKKIGEGTYAIVYLGHAKDTYPPRPVAIKKIKAQNLTITGLSMDAIREVKYLQELRHPNIILLLDVFSSKHQNLSLVLEFLDCDLEMIIKDTRGITYSMADIKSWMLMALRGVWFCHSKFVLHRDIKPNNLLISSSGVLKLGDFGLARQQAEPYRPMTHAVITRWYRPPELLFGARFYSSAVDIWSMGLVFAELLLRVPFLAGTSDVHQVELICSALGAPTEENWPGVSSLPAYAVPDPTKNPLATRQFWESMFGSAGPEGVELLMGMLKLDPRGRMSAKECLEHAWFRVEPRPTKPERLPRKGGVEGEQKVAGDLKRVAGGMGDEESGSGSVGGGELRGKKVARKLDFGGL
ncbi:protease-like protein [Kalaharituber pfeilii]|nr:protease-like protein [Kalaharituber pfeilii]